MSFALALLLPVEAAADGMDAMVGAAIAGALIAIGGVSVVASLVVLVAAILYRRRPRPTSQLVARVLVTLDLVGHLGFALVLADFAIVLIPGAVLGLVAAWIDWRTEPPLDEQGQPRRIGVAAGGAALAIIALFGLVWAAAIGAERRHDELDRLAMIEAEAALAAPATSPEDRRAALEHVLANFGRCTLDGLDLSGFDLSGKMVDRCTFVGTNLSGADMTETYAIGVDFSQTDLRGATLHKARLERTNLAGRDLRGVDLRGAQLADVDLRGAKLDGAKLDGAYMANCRLDGASITAEQLASAELSYGTYGLSEAFMAEVQALREARAGD
ncbi:MAG: pentapeptide repeat-containing protein [Myxococcales bacterium]|nr:pentapeptide repeat-containing protein [Myxococcales bacterium]